MTGKKIIRVNPDRHMVVTPKFRVSFPNVFKARSFQDAEGQTKHFSLDMIFDSREEFKKPYAGRKIKTVSMAAALLNAKADQWGKKENWPSMEYSVFKDGNTRTNSGGEVMNGYEGKWFATAKSGEKFPPKVVNLANQPIDENEFYAGCWAIAQLIARPYQFGKNSGARFLLNQLQKVGDGERFGGFGVTDVFDVSEGGDDFDGGEEDGDDDEGGF